MPGRSLLGLQGATAEELRALLDEAAAMAEILERPVPKVPALRGRRVGLAFFEPSTRTRLSFDRAAKSLGADTIVFTPGGSSLVKGESLLDSAQTLKAMGVECLVVRAHLAGTPGYLERHLGIPIVNAGDGANEHPTQALLDLFVLREVWEDRFADRLLVIVGDVARSRVARSHFWAAAALGYRIRVVAPYTFLEPGLLERFGIEHTTDLAAGLQGADAVMALRVQAERRRAGGPYMADRLDYFVGYGITAEHLASLPPEVPLLHPGPVNRGIELADEVVYGSERSRILDQVRAGVAVRMAVLYRAFGGQGGAA